VRDRDYRHPAFELVMPGRVEHVGDNEVQSHTSAVSVKQNPIRSRRTRNVSQKGPGFDRAPRERQYKAVWRTGPSHLRCHGTG